MKVRCPNCRTTYNIAEDRLKFGEAVAFQCPACHEGTIRLGEENTIPPATASEAKPPDPELRKKILRALTDLPPMPQVVLRAQQMMADPDSGVKQLASLLETDQSLVTKVLRLGNSAYYGLSGKISSVQHASVLLGYETLGELISMAGASSLLGKKLKGYGMESGDLWRHSLAVAFGSRIIARKIGLESPHEALMAGLVHDVGKIILDPYVLEKRNAFVEVTGGGRRTLLDAERAILGFDHAEIGAEACKLWNIPDAINRAIRFHHQPSYGKGNQMAYTVHMADYIATMSGIGTGIDDMLHQMEDSTMEVLNLSEENLNEIVTEVLEAVQKIAEEMKME